jgi:hypothetical protein
MLKIYNLKNKLLNISSIMKNKRRNTTRRRVMYGGQATDPFPGQGYEAEVLEEYFRNYLIAAHSMNEAAKAIEDTSHFQNSSNGTRTLQKTSALSFSTAASSFVNSLRSAYGSLSRGQPITIGTATAFAPYPAPVRAPIG